MSNIFKDQIFSVKFYPKKNLNIVSHKAVLKTKLQKYFPKIQPNLAKLRVLNQLNLRSSVGLSEKEKKNMMSWCFG